MSTNTPSASDETAPNDIIERFEAISFRLRAARGTLGEVIFGQDEVIDQVLTALVAGGHALLVGAPGLAKTLLVNSCATVLGLDDKRVQFTPDLMPADVLGTEVLDEGNDGRRTFRFIEGPIFCQMLMADEINRASPRTQSALLQAMQEHYVTVAGQTRKLPHPFHVLATQNPIEQEGTYPLPEAQLDRFLLQITIDYPPLAAEKRMLAETTSTKKAALTQAMSAEDLIAAQNMVREMPIGENIIDAILDLVRRARPNTGKDGNELENAAQDGLADIISWGPGPRASQALSLAVRARALIDGRPSPSLDDLKALAAPVLRHRMALSFAARAEGQSTDSVIADLLKAVL